jgi:predicted amidohydrolase
MHVACCQFDIQWEDKPANFRRVEAMFDESPPQPGGLLVLPEMFATGFTMNADAVAESDDGPTAAFLAGLASRHRCHVLAGVVGRRGGERPFNEAALHGPDGKRFGVYAKRRLFSYSAEDRHYAVGDAPAFFDLPTSSLQPLVCYDLRFPELFRPTGRPVAEVLAVIANWPAKRENHWVTLLRARAIENQAYVVGVNRVGSDPIATYSGRSLVVDFQGEVIADAGGDERILHASLDLDGLRAWREKFPALRDR